MGNPDLIIIINSRAFIIKGTKYDERWQAVVLAIEMFRDEEEETDNLRYNEDMTLRKDADPAWSPEEIETIRVFIKKHL